MCVDVEDMIKELKALIEIPCIVGEEGEIAKYLAEVLKNYGFTPELHRVEGDRYNVIYRVGGDRPGRTLLLNGHLEPFQLQVVGAPILLSQKLKATGFMGLEHVI